MHPRDAQSLVFQAPYCVDVTEEPLPPLNPGQLVVESLVSAISPGTEMLFYRGLAPTDMEVDETIPALAGTVRYPQKYGYATVGHVAEIADGVDGSWLGRLVFAFHPHESHFVSTPDELVPVPQGCSAERAALLPNMETAVSLVMDGEPHIGEDVAVFGQGIVGLLTTALLANFPLGRLYAIDRFEARRRQALVVGATDALAPDDLRKRSPIDADLVFELTGNPQALDQAIDATGYSGRVMIGSWYGQKRADLNLGGRFHRSRIRLIASQVSTIAPEYLGRWTKARRFDVAWSMLAKVDVEPLITHRFPLGRAADAYSLVDRHPEQAIQVLLTYTDDDPVGNA